MKFKCYFLTIILLVSFGLQGIAATEKKVNDDNDVVSTLKVGDPELDVLWIDEKNGEYLPLEAVFRNDEGTPVTLGEIIDRPTIVLPVYFYCPSSCSLNLANLASSIKRSQFNPAKDFKIIAFSFNEKEDDQNAKIAKRNYLRLLPKDFPQENWIFLTGKKESIVALTDAIGYTFKPLDDGTFIHPSALVVTAANGMIIKYVYGNFLIGDIDMAISEAASGTPSMSVRRFLNYCFNYSTEKSSTFFKNIKIGVLLGFAVLGVLYFFYVRRVAKKRKASTDEN